MDLRIGDAAGRQLVGHLELGTDRPPADLVGALQIRYTKKDVGALAGANSHPVLAVRANHLVSTHAINLIADATCVGTLGQQKSKCFG